MMALCAMTSRKETIALLHAAVDMLLKADLADHNVKKNQWTRFSLDKLRKDPELAEEFFTLIKEAYKGIGGHAKIKSPLDLLNEASIFDTIDLDGDPEPDAVNLANRKRAGEKGTASGQDGSSDAKKAVLDRKAKQLNMLGMFGEVSGALAHVLLTRYKVPVVTREEDVRKTLEGKDIQWVGPHPDGKYPGADGWYTRRIGGTTHMKIMLGRPKV